MHCLPLARHPIGEAMSCFHPKGRVEKDKLGREVRLLEAPVHMGANESISLGPSRQVGAGGFRTVPSSNCCYRLLGSLGDTSKSSVGPEA